MVSEDALERPNAQQNGLRSSGEACEEMWFYKACKDFDLSLHEIAIHPDLIPEPTHSQAHHALTVPGAVLHNAEVIDNAAAQHGFQFFRGVVAVGAHSIDERDVLWRSIFKFGENH